MNESNNNNIYEATSNLSKILFCNVFPGGRGGRGGRGGGGRTCGKGEIGSRAESKFRRNNEQIKISYNNIKKDNKEIDNNQ